MTEHRPIHARSRADEAGRRAGLRFLAGPLVHPLLRWRALRNHPVTVLVYHTLGADDEDMDAWTVLRMRDFDQQVTYLRRHYDIVSLDDAIAGRRNPARRPRAVITFDDGDVGLHTYLLPYLEKAAVPVTVYVATGQIEDGRPYWFDRIMNAVQTAAPVTLDLGNEGLGRWTLAEAHGSTNWAKISALLEKLKDIDPARRERVADLIATQTAHVPRRAVTPLHPLTRAQLRALAACPWVTLAAHSHCHNLLDQLPIDEALDSADRSRQRLQVWTGAAADHFAYPNGNYTEALARGLERAAFKSATILGHGLWGGTSDVFKMPRVPIGRYDSLDRFKLRLVGI